MPRNPSGHGYKWQRRAALAGHCEAVAVWREAVLAQIGQFHGGVPDMNVLAAYQQAEKLKDATYAEYRRLSDEYFRKRNSR